MRRINWGFALNPSKFPYVLLLMLGTWAVGVHGADGQAAGGKDPRIEQINQLVREQWEAFELEPSPRAGDAKWCRRVFLDLIGRIPTVDELDEFERDRSPQKRVKLVERLLEDARYTDAYTQHWTTYWTNVLIGRSGGTERNSLTSREGMQSYLGDCFRENRPYDVIVRELITATGINKPGVEGFNGAVNFLAMKVNDDKGALATASTSRIFLGLQVQCTQCHNHPFNSWKQQKFWEFNAFFRQTRMLRRFEPGTNDVAYAELVDEDFAGEFDDPEDAVIFYELRNGLTKAAYPVFVDGTELPTNSGFIEDINRRQQLAEFVVQSDAFERMIANRMWGYFFGHGFTKPVDDLGPHNPPSNPLLLDYLAAQIRAEDFDLKQLMRWIVLSEPYALSSKILKSNQRDDPSLGEIPQFSHFYLRQMTAEQLYESLLIATEADRTRGSAEEQEAAREEWLRQFVIAFGTDEGDESTTFNGSIPQALMMFNGDLIKEAVSAQEGGYLRDLAARQSLPKAAITHLFRAGLARNPTSDELQIAAKLYAARQGDLVATLQDLWWAILNSNEFILNH
jgi:hypothetical protein